MRIALTSLALAVLILVVGVLGFVYSGIYNVAATAPHWPIVQSALDEARVRSIKAHAKGINVPALLDDSEKLLIGTDHFAAHCAVCHGAPGVPKGDIAHGLYPQPPNLAAAAKLYTPGELFWILTNGIKMTGMPAWNDHTEDELWATVAFLEKLPTMSEEDYAKLIVATMGMGGHHHGDMEGASRDDSHGNSATPTGDQK